jgi:hypothetical protein
MDVVGAGNQEMRGAGINHIPACNPQYCLKRKEKKKKKNRINHMTFYQLSCGCECPTPPG